MKAPKAKEIEEAKEITKFERFRRAMKMNDRGTPPSVIMSEVNISASTFYKWVRDPDMWAAKFKGKPSELRQTTKDIARSIKSHEVSVEAIRGILGDLDVNDFEINFIYQYIVHRNSTEAMLRVLPPEKSLTRQAAKLKALRLVRRPHIREAIDRIMTWEMDGINMTLKNDLLGQLYRMAFYDPAMFIDESGKSRFKSIDDVPAEYRCCITGIKQTFHPKDASIIYYEITLANRNAAMKDLGQYAKLFNDNSKELQNIGDGIKKVQEAIEKNTLPPLDVTPPISKIAPGV